jgi:excinuclease ABC subunit C
MTETEDPNRLDRIREAIKSFPAAPGLYLMKAADDTVLYIGKAVNLRSRIASYFQPSSDLMATRGPKIVEMIARVQTVDYLETPSEVEAILQEARLIKDIRPPYNTDLVDDKTFPYLEITTRDEFPGVYITRNPKSRRSRLFGPFTAVRDLRAVMVVLQKIFRFRTCSLEIRTDDEKRRFFRPCLLFSIHQCVAPCADRISKAEYRKIIRDVIQFLQSKRSTVLRQLQREMEEASKALDFETAATCRARIQWIESLDRRGTVEGNVQPEVFAGDPNEAVEQLQKLFDSDQPIRVIEGFDIAHIAGSETVGSMVQFIDGKPFKSGYRHFRIKTVRGIDDYASLREIVSRRYARAVHGEELWPDMVLIDGGLGQLHAAQEAFALLNARPPILASIAKKEELVYRQGNEEPLRLPPHSPVRKLLQYVRDEAHRFAQHYHHILRSKKLLNEDS